MTIANKIQTFKNFTAGVVIPSTFFPLTYYKFYKITFKTYCVLHIKLILHINKTMILNNKCNYLACSYTEKLN